MLATTRWKLRKAAKVVTRVLHSLKLEKHPQKTFIGRIERGFDFLGYHFSPAGLSVAQQTVDNFVRRAIRLYEQEPGEPLDCSRHWSVRQTLGSMGLLGLCARRAWFRGLASYVEQIATQLRRSKNSIDTPTNRHVTVLGAIEMIRGWSLMPLRFQNRSSVISWLSLILSGCEPM